jgi:CHAT domain-containing protein
LVTTLWKVDDAATAVLMDEFYANLWHKKLTKLEALRQAQLVVLTHPELIDQRRRRLITELAERGLKLGQVRFLPTGTVARERTHPALWAPFVLSGNFQDSVPDKTPGLGEAPRSEKGAAQPWPALQPAG